MDTDDDVAEERTPSRDPLASVRIFLKVLPLIAVVFFLTYYVTERSRLFPDNSVLSDPPKAEYLVFPPAHPVEPVKPKVETVKDSKRDSIKEAPKKDVVAEVTKKEAKKETKTSDAKPARPAEPEIKGPVEGGYVVVFLSRKLVALVKDQKYLRAYPDAVVPGGAKGGKSGRNDTRAPVGNYYIVDHEPQGSVMTLVLSYPNSRDALAALKAKKITRAQYDKILSAEKQHAAPPFNTHLGGPVRIRGDGGADKKAGDICVTPEQMEVLWMATRRGTPVVIME